MSQIASYRWPLYPPPLTVPTAGQAVFSAHMYNFLVDIVICIYCSSHIISMQCRGVQMAMDAVQMQTSCGICDRALVLHFFIMICIRIIPYCISITAMQESAQYLFPERRYLRLKPSRFWFFCTEILAKFATH